MSGSRCEYCGAAQGQAHAPLCETRRRPPIDKSGARTRYCRDCRFITLPMPGAYDLATCAHPKAKTMPADFLVTGIGESRQRYCSSMRQVRAPCDEAGLLWEARHG